MTNKDLLRLQVRVQNAWTRLLDSERGQTMVEYAGIGLVVIVIVGAVASATLDGEAGKGVATGILNKISAIIGKITPAVPGGLNSPVSWWVGPQKPHLGGHPT